MSHWWETPLGIAVIDKVQFNHESFLAYKKVKVQLIENSAKKSQWNLGLETANLKRKNVCVTMWVCMRGRCDKNSELGNTCIWLISSQLCLVRTCVLIWSQPTRRFTRAPPWEPSPPPPSLSTWTTKQRRGTTYSLVHASWHLSL